MCQTLCEVPHVRFPIWCFTAAPYGKDPHLPLPDGETGLCGVQPRTEVTAELGLPVSPPAQGSLMTWCLLSIYHASPPLHSGRPGVCLSCHQQVPGVHAGLAWLSQYLCEERRAEVLSLPALPKGSRGSRIPPRGAFCLIGSRWVPRSRGPEDGLPANPLQCPPPPSHP